MAALVERSPRLDVEKADKGGRLGEKMLRRKAKA
jgi:hypothetical protein